MSPPIARDAPEVLLVTHLRDPALGLIHAALRDRGLNVVHRNLFDDDLPSDLSGWAAIVSLGGQMSVTGLTDIPFLVDELALMRAALQRELPILGLCLGAQLLAVAAGGTVARLPERYIGWPGLTLTPGAAQDPLFGDCPNNVPIIKWHGDGIAVVDPVTVLATTASPGCALFRAGPCAWGSQMHLEADETMLFDRWLPDPVEQQALRESGLDPVAFATESRVRLPVQIYAMAPVMARFADYVVQHS